MLEREEVLELISIEKVPDSGSQLIFDLNHLNTTYDLIDENDHKKGFKLDVSQSNQISFKLSCHHRDDSNFGLIRVDYNGPMHPNPQVINSNVPKFLHPYAGKKIQPRVSHVHIYVEGQNLDWAIPLDDFEDLDADNKDGINISQLEINSHSDKNGAIQSFMNTINLNAQMSFTGGLMLN